MNEFENQEHEPIQRYKRRSIMGGIIGEAGRPVTRGFVERPAEEVPGAILSPERRMELREQLAEIDRCQIPGPDGRTR